MKKQPKTNKTKKIILITILILISLAVVVLLLNSTKKINNVDETATLTYTTTIGETEYDITNLVLEAKDITPTLSAGMIPVKWDGEYWKITTKDDAEWCNYEDNKPAYIMLNDGYYRSELEVGVEEKQLSKNNLDAQIQESDLGSIYMWMPRYAYNSNGDILYIKQGCSVAGNWTLPEIFTHETTKRDFSLAGVWVEYTPLANTSAVNTKINNMKGEDNIYGFLANTVGINASNESTYTTTIEAFANTVGASIARPLINDITNTTRSILKITNSNYPEPIKAKATYNSTDQKIHIDVTYRTNPIKQILDEDGNILCGSYTSTDTGDEIIGNGTYRYVIIDNIGNMKKISVKITGLDIYVIKDVPTLKEFRDDVNAGLTSENTKAYQVADIYMNEGLYTKNESTGVCTFTSDAEMFTPIADNSNSSSYSNSFKGTYYGENHIISGLYIRQKNNYVGLFSRVSGGTIQDLGIINSTFEIVGANYIGSLAGSAYGNINNCYSKATIRCYITSATNTLTNYCGGLIGNANGSTINNCYFEGSVSGRSNVGGVVGGLTSTDKETTITNCYNKGTVQGSAYCVGGIVGGNHGPITITDCYNLGNITALDCVGGIAGMPIYTSYAATIKNCYNTGNITGTSQYSSSGGVAGCAGKGGIIGGSYSSSTDIKYCYNTGKISGGNYSTVGGISGNKGTISYCYNTASISGKQNVGGIIGYSSDAEISYCFNTGDIEGKDYSCGGIVGKGMNSNSIQNVYNTGIVKGTSYVGGICGDLEDSSYIKYAYNLDSNVNR